MNPTDWYCGIIERVPIPRLRRGKEGLEIERSQTGAAQENQGAH